MDAFWCITLGTIIIAKFWKREKRKSQERKEIRDRVADKIEQEKQKAVVEKYTAIFNVPMTDEEIAEEKARKDAEKQREKDIAELRKQGFTEEMITTIIPTINNGQ